MKSLFESESHSEILGRLDQLNETSKGLWGKMEVGQMLFHCQFPLNLALGRYEMKSPNPIMKLLFKSFKKDLYSDKQWKPNLPTAKPFKVVDSKDFSTEIAKLRSAVTDFHNEKDKKEWDPHPAFGHFTVEQWGKMQYKHLDHHLRQFGV